MYVKLNHFAVPLKLTQHYKSTILQYNIQIFLKNDKMVNLRETQVKKQSLRSI